MIRRWISGVRWNPISVLADKNGRSQGEVWTPAKEHMTLAESRWCRVLKTVDMRPDTRRRPSSWSTFRAALPDVIRPSITCSQIKWCRCRLAEMYGRGRRDRRDRLPSTGQEEALPNATKGPSSASWNVFSSTQKRRTRITEQYISNKTSRLFFSTHIVRFS
jgi:hypothetical protein